VGISRWDGTHLVNYPRPDDNADISFAEKLRRGPGDLLWILSRGQGLRALELKSDGFLGVALDGLPLGEQVLDFEAHPQRDELLVLGSSGRVYIWNFIDGELTAYTRIDRQESGQIHLADGKFYIESASRVLILDLDYQPFAGGYSAVFPELPDDPGIRLVGGGLEAPLIFSDNRVLWIVDDQRPAQPEIPLPEAESELPQGRVVEQAVLDAKGRVWIRFLDKSLLVLDENGVTVEVVHSFVDGGPESVNALYSTDDGQVLVGSFARGLFYHNPWQRTFRSWNRGLNETHQEFSNLGRDIMAISPGEGGEIWVASTDGGVARLDSRGRLIRRYGPDNGGLGTDLVKHLSRDAGGNIWVSTYRNGFYTYDPAVDAFVRPAMPGGYPEEWEGRRVNRATAMGPGELWIATHQGLYQFLSESGSLALIDFDGQSREVAGGDGDPVTDHIVWTAHRDSGGADYIAADSGLWRRERPGQDFSLLENSLQRSWFISEDNNGILYIGSPSGIRRYDGGQSLEDIPGLNEFLGSRSVYSVVPRDQLLWISTNQGIVLWNLGSGTGRNFTRADGLSSMEFNLDSYWESPEGRLFFGNIDGFNSIDGGEPEYPPTPPNVILSDIRINGETLAVGTDPRGLERLAASPRFKTDLEIFPGENYLGLTWAGISYSRPDALGYRYRILGFNPDWIDAGGENQLTLVNLQPGSYRFELLAISEDGLVSPDAVGLNIRVRPPFWRSWWFIVLMSLLSFGIALLGLFYIRRLRREIAQRRSAEARYTELNARLEEKVDEKTVELRALLDDLRMTQGQLLAAEKFRTAQTFVRGIAHEMNTPIGNALMVLSSIRGESKDDESLELIETSLRRIA
jgi:hypothetical protein